MYLIRADCIEEDLELPFHLLLLTSRPLCKSGNKRGFPIGEIVNGLFNIFGFCNVEGILLKCFKVLPVIISILVNGFFLFLHQIKNLDEHVTNRVGVQELVVGTYQVCLELVAQANVALRDL